jgi:bifunctional non-homologous end joining protein LigD
MATKIRSTPARNLPRSIDPMLATSGELPSNQTDYNFEYKWDGVRAIGFFQPRNYRLLARSGNDITSRYPELHNLSKAVGKRHVVLDGEIVSLDESGRPSFGKLQHRMHLNDAQSIMRLSKTEPVFYVLFDVLYFAGKSVMNETYAHRREILEDLTLMGDHWQITSAHTGEGSAMLAAAKQNQLEGIVAKRLDSLYHPGERSRDWIKIKIIQRQEFVVAGWVPERTGITNRIGAILVGYYDCDKQLRYAGKVGTGLSGEDHEPLLQKLAAGRTRVSPFKDRVPGGAIFTTNPAVAEIEYRRWPADGLLQQAAYKGLRTDKSAREVIREAPAQ